MVSVLSDIPVKEDEGGAEYSYEITRVRQSRTAKRLIIVFAVCASFVMLASAFAPAVQAATESFLDYYEYDYPSDTDPVDTSNDPLEFVTGDSYPFGVDAVERPARETFSYYSDIEPVLTGVGVLSTAATLEETETDYIYRTTYGVYIFDKTDPSVLIVKDTKHVNLAEASFSVDGPYDISMGSAFQVLPETTSFLVGSTLFVDGDEFGQMYVKTEFTEYSRPKISAWFQVSDSQLGSAMSIIWNVRAPFDAVRVDGTVLEIEMLSDIHELPDSVYSLDAGDEISGRWFSRCLVDWSDAECGRASIIRDSDVVAISVIFPSGMSFIDPTIVGTSSSGYATSGSPFRNSVYHEGTYWYFYHDGTNIVYAHSSDEGIEWSSPVQVPSSSCAASSPRIFDVAIQPNGDRIAVCWKDTYIEYIDGIIDSSTHSIQWNERKILSPSQDGSGHSWFGGVALASDGSAFVSLCSIYNLVYIQLHTYMKDRYSDSFVEFDNPFPKYDWRLSTPHYVQPLFVPVTSGMKSGSVALIAVVHDESTSECRLFWNEYNPGTGQWLDNAVTWQVILPSSCVYQHYSACPGIPGDDVDVHVAISCDDEICYVSLKTTGSEPSGYVDHIYTSSPAWPSISSDPGCGVYLIFTRDNALFCLRKLINDKWSEEEQLFLDDGAVIDCLTSGEVLLSRHFISYTDRSQTPDAVKFGALPIPVNFVGPYSDPWSATGVNEGQPFSMGAHDVISPGNGLLYFFQTDFVIPGRGMDMALSRFHATPQYFIYDSSGTLVPILYDQFPACEMGESWQLNLPWIDNSYVHLWSGQKVAIKWDGNWFNCSKGTQFSLFRTPSNYHLYLDGGMRVQFDADGLPTEIHSNVDLGLISDPNIRLDYEPIGYDRRLVSMMDHLDRSISFDYDPDSEFLSRLDYDGQSVNFAYTSERLTSVTNAAGITTYYTYFADPMPSVLLSEVSLTDPSLTSYKYTYDQVQIGTECYTFLVDRRESHESCTTSSYRVLNGVIRETRLWDSSQYGGQDGNVQYVFNPESLSTTVTYFEDVVFGTLDDPMPHKRTVSWYSPDGRIAKTETYENVMLQDYRTTCYDPDIIKPDVTTAVTDEQGNLVYSRGPMGGETFGSYAEGSYRNSFYRPSMLNQVSSGKIAFDDFSDWIDDGWNVSNVGMAGSAYINDLFYYGGFDFDYLKLDPCYEVAAGREAYYANLPINIGDELDTEVVVECLSWVPNSNGDIKLILTNDLDEIVAGIRFYGGVFWCWDGSGWISSSHDYSPMTVYRIAMSVGEKTIHGYCPGSYYVNGTEISDGMFIGLPLTPSREFRVLAEYVLVSRSVVVDNVKVFKNWEISVEGLEPGCVIELYDTKGNLAHRKKSVDSSPVEIALSPSDEFIPYAYFVVRDQTGRTLLIDSIGEIWGGDVYSFAEEEYLMCAIGETISGFDLDCETILDDEDINTDYYDVYGTWNDEVDPDFAMSGTEYHHDAPCMGASVHGYKAKPGSYPSAPDIGSSGSFVQWVYLPKDNYPLEIGLRYYHQDVTSSGYSDFAYWGTADLIFDEGSGVSAVRIGGLPIPGQWVRLQILASDIGWNALEKVRGIEFWHYGGDAYFDCSGLRDWANYDSIKLTDLVPLQTVELRKRNGDTITSAVANDYGWLSLDLYAAGCSAFPLSAYFVISHPDGSIDYKSPVIPGIFGGSEYSYSRDASPFYSNQEIPDGLYYRLTRLPVGSLHFLDAEETSATETYFKYGFYNSGSGNWEMFSLMSESKTKSPSGWLATKYEYDGYGNVVSTTDPTNAVLHYSYTMEGTYLESSWMLVDGQNLSVQYEYYPSGLLKKEIDAKLYETTYEYDALGRVTRIVYPEVDDEVAFEEIEYDDENLIETRYDPEGTARKTYYDELGRIVKEERLDSSGASYSNRTYTYDRKGQVNRIEDSVGRSIWIDHDFLGRTVQILNPDGTSVTTVYDDLNRTVSAYDEMGARKDVVFDAAGRLIQSIQYLDGGKIFTNMTYDRMGNLLSTTDCGGLTTTFQYDNLGRLAQTTYPYGVTEVRSYDNAGRLELIDRSGVFRDVTFTYDDAGRLKEKRTSASDWTAYTYDPNGNVETSTRYLDVSEEGATETVSSYVYDEWNRVKQETITIDGKSYTLTYDYDTRSNLRGFGVGTSWYLDYIYDEFNRVKMVVKPSTRPSSPSVTLAEFTYDNQDQIQTIEYGNGVVTSFSQNESRGWLESIDIMLGQTSLLNLDYERDSTGRVTDVNQARTFVYDSLGRLTYANDTTAYGLLSYEYDSYGNIQGKTHGSSSWTYTYDSYKRLKVTSDPEIGSCSYDSIYGTLQTWTLYGMGVTAFYYDGDNHLTRVTEDANSWAYWYDAAGRRVKSVENGDKEITIYSGSSPVLTVKGIRKAVLTYHVYASGIHIAKAVSGKTLYYYHQDDQGSVRLVTDKDGAVVFDTDYLPFGEPYAPDGTEEFLYGDARATPFGSFVYFGDRYYDTHLGRFLNPDKILGSVSTPTSMNRWLYCSNDPINRMDKTGTWGFSIVIDSVCNVGGSIVDSAVDLAGDAIEFAVDVVAEIAETAVYIARAAIDAAERFKDEVVDASTALANAALGCCMSIKAAWDNMDSGLKQWIITGVSIAVSFIPVVGPLISCIIDGTFVDMLSAISTGDWAMLSMCAMAFIPGAKVMKGLKAIGGFGDLAKVGKKAAKSGVGTAKKRAVVIGEDMNRVKPFAKRGGYDHYVPPKGLSRGDRLEANRAWINSRMDEGCSIIDIGPAPGRANFPGPTSPYYKMEIDELTRRDYSGWIRL